MRIAYFPVGREENTLNVIAFEVMVVRHTDDNKVAEYGDTYYN